MRRRTLVLCSGVLQWLTLLCGCSGQDLKPPTSWEPQTDAHLSYRLALTNGNLGSALAVTVIVRAVDGTGLPPTLVFEVPRRWAGFDDLHEDLTAIRAASLDGRPLEAVQGPDRLEVRQTGLAALVLNYQVVPGARELTRLSRFHAVGGPGLFFAYGRDLLVRPVADWLDGAPVHVELATPHEGEVWATTLGVFPAGGGQIEAPLRDLLDAAYMAGQVRLVSRPESGVPFALAIDPRLTWNPEPILNAGQRLVTYTFNELGAPPNASTVGLVVRRADDPGIMMGSGRPGGFVIELGDRAPLEGEELALLIAHENLHRYIGIWLSFAPGEERETLWFGEGAVQYLSAQAVVRSGLATPDLLLEALSDALGGYLLNECADGVCQSEGDEAFWRFPSLRQSSYHRGFLLAFWLDVELRRVSHRLVGVVQDLLRTHAGRRGITNEDIRLVLERRLGRDLGDWFETYVVQSRRLPWQEWLAEAGLSVRRVTAEEPVRGTGIHAGPGWVVVRVDSGFDRLMGWSVGADGPFE